MLNAYFPQVSQRLLLICIAGLLLLLAAGTRFHQLEKQSLWHDEGNSYIQATRSFAEIADNAGRDIHPPGYYWLLAVWRVLVGETEFGLRSLSAFASILTGAFTFALGVKLFGRTAGIAAALFIALNTFSIYYAQEARMYALLALWSSASMWALVGFIKALNRTLHGKDSRIAPRNIMMWGGALAVFNTAGLYTQYAFPFVMISQGILFVLWWGSLLFRVHESSIYLTPTIKVLGYFVAANVITLLLFAPWMPQAWEQVTQWPNTGTPIKFSEALSIILAYLSFGITVGSGTNIAVIFFLLFGLIQLPETARTRTIELPRWWRMLIPIAWVLSVVGLFFGLELFREANLKFLLPAQIGFALWMGRGVSILASWKVQRTAPVFKIIPKLAALMGVLMILSILWDGLNPLYEDAAYQRDDYRAIVATINQNSRPGDAIILSAPNQWEVFTYYYKGDVPIYPLPRGLGGDDAATLAEMQDIIANHQRIYAVLWATSERDSSGIVENTLDSEAYEADSTWYGNVRLVRYVSPVVFDSFQESGDQFGEHITLQRYALNTQSLKAGDVLQIQLQWSTNALLETPYKVFIQLLDSNGVLMAQRDAEPGGGQFPTVNWNPGDTITDNHALIVPNNLPSANYSLIVGLYNRDDPQERLPINDGDFMVLDVITIE